MSDQSTINPWFRSKTIWSGLIAIVLTLISVFTGVGAAVTSDEVAIVLEASVAAIGSIAIIANRILARISG